MHSPTRLHLLLLSLRARAAGRSGVTRQQHLLEHVWARVRGGHNTHGCMKAGRNARWPGLHHSICWQELRLRLGLVAVIGGYPDQAMTPAGIHEDWVARLLSLSVHVRDGAGDISD